MYLSFIIPLTLFSRKNSAFPMIKKTDWVIFFYVLGHEIKAADNRLVIAVFKIIIYRF